MNMTFEYQGNNPSLAVLAAKRFPKPVRFPLTAYSHNHDLLAIVTSTWEVQVFRITSGQLAFTIVHKEGNVEVTALSWKTDGSVLGVGWSDGSYVIYEGGSGNPLTTIKASDHEREDGSGQAGFRLDLRTKDPDDDENKDNKQKIVVVERPNSPKVCLFGWANHEITSKHRKGAHEGAAVTTDDWYDAPNDEDDEDDGLDGAGYIVKKTNAAINLPRAITCLDASKILPRLSAVPSHKMEKERGGPHNDTFNTQRSTDDFFLSQKQAEWDAVQSLFVCQDHGSVQVLLDDTVKLGSSRLKGKSIAHTAHPRCASQAILAETDDAAYQLHLINLPVATLGSPLLHVITSNTKSVQLLMDYIVLTLRCLIFDYETNTGVIAKFMGILTEDCEKESLGDGVTNLYHLAMTGRFGEPVLSWVAGLKSRNLARWDQMINGMYTNLTNHLFINLLPALERLSIALTTLRGHATFHEGSSKFDCPPEQFTKVLDKVDSLRLVAHKMLVIIQTEHKQFRAFYKWLKLQVDIADAGPESDTASEMEQREVPGLDYALILAYIKDTLTLSKLDLHIQERPGMIGEVSKDRFFNNPIIRDLSFERTKQAMERLNNLKPGEELKMKDVHDPAALLNVSAIGAALVGHVRMAQQRITQWQSRMLSPPIATPIPQAPGTQVLDMIMVPSISTSSAATIKLLFATGANTIQVTEIVHVPESPSPNITNHQHDLGQDSELIDAKWILHIPTANAFLTLRKDVPTGDVRMTRHELAPGPDDEADHDEILHNFPSAVPFRPDRMLIGGRKGKLLIVVFGNKGKEWRVLDLDNEPATLADEGREQDEDFMDVTS